MNEPHIEEKKVCTKCKKEKHIRWFYRLSNGRGHDMTCKSCRKQRMAEITREYRSGKSVWTFEKRVIELRKQGLCVLDIARKVEGGTEVNFSRVRKICERPGMRAYGKADIVQPAGDPYGHRATIKGGEQ